MRLLFHCQILKKSRLFVLMKEGGFGHTVTGPDVARRLFPDKRVTFIILSETRRHNRKVSKIWPDLHVIFLPIYSTIYIGNHPFILPNSDRFRKIISHLVIGLINRMINPAAEILFLEDLYERILGQDLLRAAVPHLSLGYRWPMAYFKLQARVKAPKLKVPSKQESVMRTKLKKVRYFAKCKGFCCLYLRQKDAGSKEIASSSRVGSSLENYLTSVEALNQLEYQVLLVGDVSLSRTIRDKFKGMFVDAKSLNVHSDWFHLFAATEADIFIGESGGGIWVPEINEIPMLCVNAFPYYYGLPRAWMFYKMIRDRTNQLVPYHKLFSDHPYDYEFKEMTVCSNTESQIYFAVTCFLEDISRKEGVDSNPSVMNQIPENTWVKQANSRLSPAWLQWYENELNVRTKNTK